MEPNTYLFGWREIMDALKLEDSRANRRRVQRLNESQVGPIRRMGRGRPPRAELAKLLEWWNGLDDRWQEISCRRRDKQESVASKYDHGRDGVVYPEISGHEVKRNAKN